MACKESICRNCFHSYVCERFNENKYDNNEKCHFANDHYIPRADVAPRAEVERLERILNSYSLQYGTVRDQQKVIDEAKREVAREIFEEIEKYILENCCVVEDDVDRIWKHIAELKKKYTENDQ